MRVLITGGAGFIGSNLIEWWRRRFPADELVNLDLLTYAGANTAISHEEPAGCQFIRGDVCDAAVVRRVMDGCDTVIHCAAETHVDRSITNARSFIRSNVEGTQVVLEVARELRVSKLVYVSTDEVYGPVLEGVVDETARLSPRSPYAASKAAADLLVQAHVHTYGLPAVIVRPTNTFGMRQFPEKFIPLCVTNVLEGRRIPIYGDGLQRRNWLFVEDLCEALACVVRQGALQTIYNIPSRWELANLEVAKTMLRLLEAPESLIEFVADRPAHDRRYAMDGARMSALGWAPRVSFDDGLRTTIAWYRAHTSWWRPLKVQLREDPYHWLNRPTGPGAGQVVRRVL